MAKAFLEPKTYNKVKFVYSDDLNTMKLMEELFDLDQLESAFGGRDNVGFDISKYAERMREDDKRMPLFGTNGSPLSVSAGAQPALTSAASLDSLNLDSDSDASNDDKTESSLPHGVDSEIVSPDENIAITDGSRKASEDVHQCEVVTLDDKACT